MKKDSKRKQDKRVKQNRIQVNGIEIAIPKELQIETGIDALSEDLFDDTADKACKHEEEKTKIDPHLTKALAQIATNAWRANKRVTDSETKEPLDEYRLLYRDINGIMNNLNDIGVVINDLTGRRYDPGMAIRPLSFEPTPGITKDEIIDTIKPEIRWNGHSIQMSEVIVGSPLPDNDKTKKEKKK